MRKKIFNWFFKKSVGLNSILEYLGLASPLWSGRNYYALAWEGYSKNIIVYHCISQITQAIADLPLLIKVGGKEEEKGEIATLLKKPNPAESYKIFMRKAATNLLISGNAYILGIPVSTGRIMALQALRPDRVTIQTNNGYIPYQFTYFAGDKSFVYPIDPITLESDILHIKQHNPLDDIYGLSPIGVAMMAVDTHNESTTWNKRLLQNSARPAGILTIKGEPDTPLPTEEQVKKISDQINEKYAGANNAGKIPIANFMMDWKQMGFSPADMEWIKSRQTSARDICLAFGYPAYLLGMPEGATFNNVSEAKLSLYEETVIPLARLILSELSRHLTYYASSSGKSSKDIEIDVDIDKVTALTVRRYAARDAARSDYVAGILKLNEARAEGGYEPVPLGDQIFVPANKLPLDFDIDNFTKQHYAAWLKQEGFTDAMVKKMVEKAF